MYKYGKSSATPKYRSDCLRILKAFRRYGFYDVNLVDCEDMWSDYSDTLAAGWLGLPETDEEILRILVIDFNPEDYE